MLSEKTGEGGGKQIDYDMQRCSPVRMELKALKGVEMC